jgi:hypothetical protein
MIGAQALQDYLAENAPGSTPTSDLEEHIRRSNHVLGLLAVSHLELLDRLATVIENLEKPQEK